MSNRYYQRQNERAEKRRRDNSPYDDFDKVFTYDHLLVSAQKCKRAVGWKMSVQNYSREMFYQTYKLYDELHKGTFKIKCPYEFDTYDRGKKRHIRSIPVRERVVQHCLCDYCLTPILKRTFIYDNCATLKGKGTTFALNRVVAHLQKHYRQHGTEGYVLLFDFSNFFASVNHKILIARLSKYVTDEHLLRLTQAFVEMQDGEVGLNIGNQVSQILALFTLSPIDHLIKDRYGVQHYVRYMDDGIIIHHDRAFLKFLLREIDRKATELGLSLNHKKTHIAKLSSGFSFLKKRISINEKGSVNIRVSRRSITRMRQKLKTLRRLYDGGQVTAEEIKQTYLSWRGLTLHYDSYHTVKSMDELYHSLFDEVTK